jgi:tripartite-type tricarboxylate transporter receptor subunit TctC
MFTGRESIVCCVMSAACIVGTPTASAQQNYPDKPIRIVVGYPPGGSSDFSARLLSTRLSTALNQSIVVDNRGGAAGNIANEIVVKSAPDGYTLLVTAEASITINASVYKNLPFVAARDLTAVTQIIKYANVVVVHPSVPATNVKELIAYAKANPGRLSFSSPGTGTAQHLAVELFKITIGADMTHVPYKGGGPAMISLVGNETQLSFATPPSAMPQVKAGRLRAIAQTSDKRSAALPDLPTVSEAGLPGFNVEGWVGLFAPAKTPAVVIERLNAESAKILRVPEVKELALGVASEAVGNPSREANQIVHDETAMWAKVVKTLGIKIE